MITFTVLQITKEEVDSFKPKQRIPSCQLTAGWTKENKPSQLVYKVTLEGVRVPSNYFHIVLDGVPPGIPILSLFHKAVCTSLQSSFLCDNIVYVQQDTKSHSQ